MIIFLVNIFNLSYNCLTIISQLLIKVNTNTNYQMDNQLDSKQIQPSAPYYYNYDNYANNNYHYANSNDMPVQVYAYPVNVNNSMDQTSQLNQTSQSNQSNQVNQLSDSSQANKTNQGRILIELERFVNKYEISMEYAIKLRQLEGFDIVVIADDSGSMSTPVKNPNTKDFKNLPTRWQEMKETLSVITELAMILDNDGIDVYFLNREPLYNVKSPDILNIAFSENPSGYTPIVPIFRNVLSEKTLCLSEKKLLIIIATDGEPTNEKGEREDKYGNTEINKLFNLLKNDRKPSNRIFTTILACTDDDETMDYLENWDKKLLNFDLVDDYFSEKNRIQKYQGHNFKFSRGDYIVKIMLGSIDKTLDSLDGSSVNNYLNDNLNRNVNKKSNIEFEFCNIL